LIAAVFLAAALLPGCATTPDVDPVQVKLDDVDTRLGRVESVVNNQSLLELSRRIDALEVQQRTLRGASEESQNSGEALRKQQRDLYGDLDKRLALLENATKSAVTAGANSESSAAAAGSAGEQGAYDRAFNTLKSGRYEEAVAQWLQFMKAYPNSALQDNAQYWLGETYYVTRDFDQAALAFKGVLDRWPDARKAPDAMLKLGYCQQEKKQLGEARATLKLVQTRFPGTEAARLAGVRLNQIGTAPR
jgi:tol-pal system protein YbgF